MKALRRVAFFGGGLIIPILLLLLVIGASLLSVGVLIRGSLLIGFGVAVAGGAVVGAGFQLAASHQMTTLAQYLRITQMTESVGLIAVYPRRSGDLFEAAIRAVRVAEELWIVGITLRDFASPNGPLRDELLAFLGREGSKLHTVSLNRNSNDYRIRREMNQPSLLPGEDYELDRHYDSAASGLRTWATNYPGRVDNHVTGIMRCWILMSRSVVFVQQYHIGYPPDINGVDVRRLLDSGEYLGVSHEFPVLEFRGDSKVHKTLMSHIEQLLAKYTEPLRDATGKPGMP